jgi:hypothetical protein
VSGGGVTVQELGAPREAIEGMTRRVSRRVVEDSLKTTRGAWGFQYGQGSAALRCPPPVGPAHEHPTPGRRPQIDPVDFRRGLGHDAGRAELDELPAFPQSSTARHQRCQSAQELREDPVTRSIPVIAVAASVMAHDQKRIMAAGFDGFQGKPISVRELLETVRRILDKI